MTSVETTQRISNLSPAKAGYTALALYCLAHFVIDLYSSALSSFQPLLGTKLGLSLQQAGWLGGIYIFSSSLLQPLYGMLSDRFQTRMFTALAPAVAGVFISMLGVTNSYGVLLLLVVLGGVGIASFHPQASARATLGLESGKQKWFAVFISSGTLGYALGPSFFSAALGYVPLESSWYTGILGLLMSAILLVWLPEASGSAGARRTGCDWAALRAVWKPLAILYALVFIRSIVQVTFAQMLPLYLFRERHYTYAESTHGLTLYLTAGALGGFIGGNLADRFGGKRVIVVSMIGCVPFLALFFWTSGWLSLAGLAMGGLMLLFTIPVNVVMGQKLVPAQAGTISALMMGFAWGLAGLIFVPLTGWVADHTSLEQALAGLIAFPLLGFLLALLLPADHGFAVV